jgi:hypothetical protein
MCPVFMALLELPARFKRWGKTLLLYFPAAAKARDFSVPDGTTEVVP